MGDPSIIRLALGKQRLERCSIDFITIQCDVTYAAFAEALSGCCVLRRFDRLLALQRDDPLHDVF